MSIPIGRTRQELLQATSPGQALIELAFALPILMLAFFLAVDGAFIIRANGNVAAVAQYGALQVARANGETAAVDAAIVDEARSAGLDPAQLEVRVTTNNSGSVGAWHLATDPCDPPSAPGAPCASWPAPGTGGSDVVVEVRYLYSPPFTLGPAHAVHLIGSALNTTFSAPSGGPAS